MGSGLCLVVMGGMEVVVVVGIANGIEVFGLE